MSLMAVEAARVSAARVLSADCWVDFALTRASIIPATSMPEPSPAIEIVPAIGFFLVQ